MKIDISKNELYITDFYRVIQNRMPRKCFPPKEGRASDGLIYILKGSCMYTFSDGTRFTVSEGNVLYLAHDSIYSMVILDDVYEVIYSDFMFGGSEQRQSMCFTLQDSRKIENLFYRLKQAYLMKQSGYQSDCLAILYQLYTIILKASNASYLTSHSKKQIEQARAYILGNFSSKDLTVKTLAQQANISEVYFRKMFYAYFHCSPNRYIVNVRLSNAKELMRDHYLTLEDVAFQTGFSSLSYFCRVFKEHTGMTPRTFRSKLLT